jgi:hypothetical protein
MKEITIKLYVKAPESWTKENYNVLIEKMKIGRAVWDSGCIYEDAEASVCDYKKEVYESRTNVRHIEIE